MNSQVLEVNINTEWITYKVAFEFPFKIAGLKGANFNVKNKGKVKSSRSKPTTDVTPGDKRP